jgi:hypothetical protein
MQAPTLALLLPLYSVTRSAMAWHGSRCGARGAACGVARSVVMKRRGGCVKLVMAVDEASRMMGDGESRCRVASPMPRPPYIQLGWFQTAHQGISLAGGDSAPKRHDLLLFPTLVEY